MTARVLLRFESTRRQKMVTCGGTVPNLMVAASLGQRWCGARLWLSIGGLRSSSDLYVHCFCSLFSCRLDLHHNMAISSCRHGLRVPCAFLIPNPDRPAHFRSAKRRALRASTSNLRIWPGSSFQSIHDSHRRTQLDHDTT